MRRLRVALLSLMTAVPFVGGARGLRGEPPPDAREVARRAVEAARDGRAEALPDLRRWLVACASRDDVETLIARLAVLDAMVQLHSVEGPETIGPCLRRGMNEMNAAVVLAVKHADGPTLLAAWDAIDAGDAGDEEPWLALGNALAARRTPGFTFRLLARLGVELRILVDDTTDTSPRWREPSGSVPGDGRIVIPPGFPPIAVYALWGDPIQDTPLLVDGPRPVRFSRTIATTEIGFGSVWGMLRRDDARLEWIASLLGRPLSDLGLARVTVRSVVRISDRAFLETVGAARRALSHRVETLGARLRAGGLLSEEERAAVRPRVRVAVTDRREGASLALPSLPSDWTELGAPVTPPSPDPKRFPSPR